MSDPFRRLTDLLDCDLWIEQADAIDEGCSLAHFITDRQTCVMRLEFDLDLPLWYMASYWRPDVLSRYGRGQAVNFDIIKDIAPGDAIVRASFASRALAGFLRLTVGSARTDSDGNVARIMLRRNFPEAGQVTRIILFSEGGGRQPLLGQQEPQRTAYQLVTASARTEFCRLVQIAELPWPKLPSWMVWCWGLLVRMQRSWAAEHRSLPLQDSARPLYMTLALKNCSRGLPAVPCREGECTPCVQVGEYTWAVVDRKRFCLAEYLNVLLGLGRLGCRAFASLDGQNLVAYQAAMRIEDWEASRPHLERLMQLQSTAYRRLRGGTGAPKLRPANEAHFTGEFVPYKPLCMQPPGLTLKNTFVECPDLGCGPSVGRFERRAVESP